MTKSLTIKQNTQLGDILHPLNIGLLKLFGRKMSINSRTGGQIASLGIIQELIKLTNDNAIQWEQGKRNPQYYTVTLDNASISVCLDNAWDTYETGNPIIAFFSKDRSHPSIRCNIYIHEKNHTTYLTAGVLSTIQLRKAIHKQQGGYLLA